VQIPCVNQVRSNLTFRDRMYSNRMQQMRPHDPRTRCERRVSKTQVRANCQGTLEPKGHNRNNCRRMQTATCEICSDTGHNRSNCPRIKDTANAAARATKALLSLACPEHKCTATNCKGTLEPKGHNRKDCPRMQTAICNKCGELGHSANKCPILSCSACGLQSHKLRTCQLCPEHVTPPGRSCHLSLAEF
jgi:hypothetical protein